jgi:GNAT superfamily N-acetyltransferase
MPDVRPASLDDAELLARISAAGFYDDPVLSWVLRDDARRLGQLVVMFRSLVEDTLPDRGTVHLAEDACTAIWRNPDFEHGRMAADRLEGTADPAAGAGPFSAEEMARIEIMGDAMREAHPHEPHWYLNVVSTLPDRQGQGLGATVLQPVLARCDAEGVPAYLESTNPRNRTLYRRQGFVDMDEILLPDGPSMLQMWRDPQA